jgi:outer membrane biogenesis lipoprotein LolB
MTSKNKQSEKKSMSSKARNVRAKSRQPAVLLLLSLLLLVNGCARSPWSDPVDDEQHRQQLISEYDRYRELAAQCSPAFDGNLIVNWQTTVDSVSLSGYYQIMRPSSLRLNVTNPLGQPLVVIATAAGSFQVLHVPRQTFYAGSLRSYALRNDVSLALLSGPFFDWLTGRPIAAGVRVAEINEDSSARGFWYAVVRDGKKGAVPIEHVLLDPAAGMIMERIVVDEQGEFQARISYDNRQEIDGCAEPLTVTITGISFWAEAKLQFSEVRPAGLTATDFKLPVPSGYLQQIMP